MATSRRIITVVAVASAAAFVVAVVGCGRPADPTAPATPSGGDVVSSGPMPAAPTTPTDPPANEILPEAAVDLVAVPWARAQPVSGAPSLLVHGTLTGGPPCAVVGRVDVAETGTAVTVTVWVGRRPGADCDGPQPDLGFPYVTRVRLAAPVDGREVRDGAR